ncbi:hypothetical protein DFR29_11720 [Tahibacter aquaticus]|uniref:Lipocalin-like protein n=2 Tax=Tahibacter aquaticus TaxID=520092 RepID=A0A4R6YNB1_9GAMM|nr:hypothetical protein DFR29_11720 [Tahibacter aquaticus]
MQRFQFRTMKHRAVSLCLAILLQCSNVAFAANAHEVFGRLGGLVGDWEGVFANGRRHSVNYRLSAGGTVLVETWALAPGRESLTLYYVDGDDLLATHYCPQGTQPRLKLVGEKGGRLQFELLDGGNLGLAGKSHQQSFWLQWDGGDGYRRSETYVENASSTTKPGRGDPEVAVSYKRVR